MRRLFFYDKNNLDNSSSLLNFHVFGSIKSIAFICSLTHSEYANSVLKNPLIYFEGNVFIHSSAVPLNCILL